MKIDESHFIDNPTDIAPVDPAVLAAKQRFGIVGNSPLLMAAIERAVKVAPVDLSVLVTGESGSGKEFFPRIIHQGSPRRHARYIAVNCGAIPEGTIDSELFGHEKGSFTGAIATRKGYFEEADGGTIFLDEVAELPLTTQARLLRVLETGEFIKVGSSEVQRTNVRIVAATNVDLLRAIAEGTFREDLYYRLSTVQINVPPLRVRGNDIELLARRFAADFAERYHTPSPVFDDAARRRLLHYAWPGNVRQLKNVIEQISLFESGKEVTLPVLDSYLEPPRLYDTTQSGGDSTGVTATHSYATEREMLFNMILSLRSRVDSLTERLDALGKCDDVTAHDCVTEAKKHAGLLPPAPTNIVERPSIAEQPSSVEQPSIVERPEGAPSETLAEKERRAIVEALERYDGRRRPAAKDLGMPERTLYRKIKEYGITE